MSVIISKGLTIHNGLSVGTPSVGHGEIVATDNYTILNFIWRVKHKFLSMLGFLALYDYCGRDVSGVWIVVRDIRLATVYIRPNGFDSFKGDPAKSIVYKYNPDLVSYSGHKSCLIDVTVNTYLDSYKLIIVYNDNVGKAFYKSNSYYLNIILLALDN